MEDLIGQTEAVAGAIAGTASVVVDRVAKGFGWWEEQPKLVRVGVAVGVFCAVGLVAIAISKL